MSIIIAYIVGVFIFGESINRYTILAIIFAMLAIYFAHRQDEE
jgi:drug/metabolite transporter (DMT)-like permease